MEKFYCPRILEPWGSKLRVPTLNGTFLEGRQIYLLSAIGLTLGGNGTIQIYTRTIHRTTQLVWEECGPCPVFAGYYTLAFALHLRKKHGKTSVRVEPGKNRLAVLL